MEFIEIAGAGKKVSRLIKGTDYFFHDTYEKAATNLDAFLAIGGNTVDTAHIYCGGQSEEVLGRYMKERGNRNQMVILTKGAHHDQNGPRVNADAIRKDLTESLERLQTEHVELYALHRDDPNMPVVAILEALNEHIESGKIGAIGASSWTWRRLKKLTLMPPPMVSKDSRSAARTSVSPKRTSHSGQAVYRRMPKRSHGMSKQNCRSCPGLPRLVVSSLVDSHQRYATMQTWCVYSTVMATGNDCVVPGNWLHPRIQRRFRLR